jgi:hypothetical protein
VQIGDVLASKYRVERVLGQGGMGVVVAARHEQLGFPVALKFMLPVALQDSGMKERFLREARAAGSLRSEHVARVMDFGTLDDGAPYIVMEFLQGSDLQDVLEAAGTLPPHEAVEYLLQACKGMEEAHAQGIVHRDLKPQNLFLTRRPDGTPLIKVLDFGISKLVGQETSLSVTSSTAMMGSPLYMAPEQIRSSKNVDARADIYSLGVILYQLLSGQVPIPADTLGELFEAVFTKTTPPLRHHRADIAPDLEAVVMRSLAKAPEDRFQTIGELAAALLPFADPRRSFSSLQPSAAAPRVAAATTGLGPTTTAGSVSAPRLDESVVIPKRRGGIWLGVVAAAAVVLVGAAVVVVRPGASGAGGATADPPPASASSTHPPPPASAALAPIADPVPSALASAAASASSAPVAAAPASPAKPQRAATTPASPAPAPVAPAAPSAKPTATHAPAKPAGADPFSSPD